MDQPLLQIQGLSTYFFTQEGTVKAVENVDLNVYKEQVVGLVGESGCGKSTVALSILRLVQKPGKIVSGKIVLNGRDLLMLNEKEIRKIRGGEISMIFQDPNSSLNPVYKIGEQIGEAVKLHQGIKNKKELRNIVVKDLLKVGIPDGDRRYSHYPYEFSGGMRQRVMIAMAISCNPMLIIADEPTTSLDVTIQAQVLETMKELIKNLGASVILITHNMGVVAEMCNFVYVMYAGRIVECGDVVTIFKNPRHPYTYLLMKAIPKIGGKKGKLVNIPGNVPELIRLPPGCVFYERCKYAKEKCRDSEPELIEYDTGHKVACFMQGEIDFKLEELIEG